MKLEFDSWDDLLEFVKVFEPPPAEPKVIEKEVPGPAQEFAGGDPYVQCGDRKTNDGHHWFVCELPAGHVGRHASPSTTGISAEPWE